MALSSERDNNFCRSKGYSCIWDRRYLLPKLLAWLLTHKVFLHRAAPLSRQCSVNQEKVFADSFVRREESKCHLVLLECLRLYRLTRKVDSAVHIFLFEVCQCTCCVALFIFSLNNFNRFAFPDRILHCS